MLLLLRVGLAGKAPAVVVYMSSAFMPLLRSHEMTRCPGKLTGRLCLRRDGSRCQQAGGGPCHPPALGVTETNLTETIQFHGRMQFSTHCQVILWSQREGEGCSLPTHPLVWWPHTRMTPAPRAFMQLSEPFEKGRADGLDKFLFLKQR